MLKRALVTHLPVTKPVMAQLFMRGILIIRVLADMILLVTVRGRIRQLEISMAVKMEPASITVLRWETASIAAVSLIITSFIILISSIRPISSMEAMLMSICSRALSLPRRAKRAL